VDIVFGIDGGGTKTAAIILDAIGHVLGFGEGGPSTYGTVPRDVTRSSIAEAISDASQSAGLREPAFSSGFIGLGNVVSDADRNAIREIAAGLMLAPEERIGVDHDCRVALAGGLSGRPGIVLISGTGTSCYGRNAAGESWRSGGWGPLIDDEGSGYWLGIQALRAAVRDYDGRGRHSLLAELVRDHLQLKDMNDLMNRLYAAGMTRTDIARLSVLVYLAASEGDTVAVEVIQAGCRSMAECVLAVANRLKMRSDEIDLALVGGQTLAGPVFLGPIETAIHRHLPGTRILQAELSPAAGAGILALQELGVEVGPSVLDNIRRGMQKPARLV
jgi:N-acetylglucosamine kinase-like BadF-type ATPase